MSKEKRTLLLRLLLLHLATGPVTRGSASKKHHKRPSRFLRVGESGGGVWTGSQREFEKRR